MENFRPYTLAIQSWNAQNEAETIVLTDTKGTILGRIPYNFTQRAGGDLSQTQYLFLVVDCLLKDGARDIAIHFQGQPIQAADPVRPGKYVVQVELGLDAEAAEGPHAKTTTRKPFEPSEGETTSNSSRSSRNGQSKFRSMLFQRDSHCLLTHVFLPDRLRACHIVPFSLGSDFVSELSNGICNLYSPANGLTLRSDYHSLFDNYKFGIYCSNGQYQVHFFNGDVSLLQHHGQWLEFPETVRLQAPDWLPNAKCLAWHYKQCILTGFRGYNVPFKT